VPAGAAVEPSTPPTAASEQPPASLLDRVVAQAQGADLRSELAFLALLGAMTALGVRGLLRRRTSALVERNGALAREVEARKQAEAELRRAREGQEAVIEARTRELVAASEALARSEALFRGYFDLPLMGKAITSLDKGWLVINDRLCAMLGYTREELSAKTWEQLTHPDDLAADLAQFSRVLAGAQDGYSLEKRFLRKDGSVLWTHLAVHCSRDAAGKPVQFAAALNDIAERKRAEQERLNAEARFRTFFETATEAMGVSSGGVTVLVNPAYARLFGYERPEELVGRPILDLIAPAEHARVADFIRRRAAGESPGSTYDLRARRRDGAEFTLEVRVGTYAEEAQVFAVVVLRDVTARREEAERLEERERRYRHLFEQVPVGVWVEDLSGVKVLVDRLRAAGVTDLVAHLRAHPAEAVAFAAAARVLDVNATACELAGARDKEDLLAHLDRVFLPETVADAAQGIAQLAEGRRVTLGEGWSGTLDGSRRWLAVRGVLVPGHEADWSRVLATTVDLTDRRREAEERLQLQERLRQAEKLEAVGRLAGGVAHDFNNLLSVILTCSSGAAEDLAAGRPVQLEDVKEIVQAAERARDLTRQLLTFARKQVVAPAPLDLNQAVRSSEKLLRRVLSEAVALEVRLGPGPLTTVCDPGQLEQVLLNLAVNARDAMPGGGRLTIETGSAVVPAGAELAPPPGRWVQVRVSDTGPGLSPEVEAHLFEPFFTTKPVGKGTGLGLPTVHGIVTQAGGHIQVESHAGHGTTFQVSLPWVDGPAEAGAALASPRQPGGNETILVIEDDPHVRQAAVRALGSAGYRVLLAANGDEALVLVASLPAGTLRLVVSDVVMPGLDGRAVVDELRRRHGPLRALFVSGYPRDVLGDGGMVEGSIQLLQKPFTGELLRTRVRAVLDQL
jgi:PAS domain S-box-containing protein